jgi:outer membrane receptor protein involved in Fe transport
MRTILITAFLWLLAASSAPAQQSTGTIAGRVIDPQGSAVAGATVTARNPETGLVRTATSDSAGGYRLPALPVAVYEVRIVKEGFETVSRQGVDVNVAQTQSIDFRLRIAGVAQQVTVTAALPLIDATNSSVGQVVDPRRMQDLPINGRQFANLAATLPGVGLAFHSDPSKGTNYAPLINGGAGRNINYQIDGGDNNDDTVGGLLQQFPLEAIEEFHFETQRFKAEYGRSNGGVMNVVTKSGTNQFQGTTFELFRDKTMNALTETEKLAGAAAGVDPTKGNYRRNQFGGSLGGPLSLDRVHFFFAVERTQQDTTQTVDTKGLFSDQDGVYPTPLRDNLATVKVSANISREQFISVRYGRNTNTYVFGSSPTATPNNWGDAQNRFNSVNFNYNWVLAGARLNEVVFQYSNFSDFIEPRAKGGANQVFPNQVTTGSSLAAPQRTEQVKYQIRDDFSWLVAGHGGVGHTFKAGGNFINEPRLFIDGASGKGVTSYTMLKSSLSSSVASVIMINGEASANIPTKQYGFYVQDDWRASDRLTFNAGVRYDLVTGLNFDQSLNPNFVKVQAAARAGALDGIVGLENFGLDPRSDRNNVQPRIGGTYDVTGTGNDIVRAGWGIYTDFGYTNSNVLAAALDASGHQFGTVFSATSTTGLRNPDGSVYKVGESLDNLLSQNQVSGAALVGSWVDPRLEQPYQLQTNVGWSHELTSNTVIGIDYVNSRGRDLNYKPRLNQRIPGTPKRRISNLLLSPLSPDNSSDRPALSRGRSEYNALIFSGRRRFAMGFDFSASYMLSKAVSTIGNASDELNTANIQDASNPFDNPVQLGPNVTTDARHRINLSAVVQLPFGVQVAPFLLYRSALPIFLVDGRDGNGDGDRFDIPTDAFAVASTDSATGKATLKTIGPCETVNCGRGWAQSQLNLRVSKRFAIGNANLEAIGEVFNLFNAINPSNIVSGGSANRTVFTTTGVPDPTLLQPASFSGDSQRPEQRVGQIGLRFSF